MAIEKKDETTAIWATFRDSSAAVKTILAGVLLSKLGGFLNIFIVLYLTYRGYTEADAAWALGAYGVGGVAGVLLGGTLADRLGARNATVIGMGGTAVLTASLLYLPSYPALVGAIVLASLMAQLYRPAAAALLSGLTSGSNQVVIFGMYRWCLNVGAMAAPMVGLGLYHLDGEGYTLLFWGEAVIALAYALVAASVLPRRVPREDAGEDAAEGSKDFAAGYRLMFRDRRYMLYLTATFFNAIVYVQYLSTLPLDVAAHNIDLFWYTAAVSLNGFMVILFELPLTRWTQLWRRKVTICVSFLLVGLGVALYGLPLGAAVIIGATLVWTLGEIIGGPAFFAHPAEAGPEHLRGQYIGSFQFMHALGTAIGPVLGGLLFVRMGHSVWPFLGAIGLIGAVLAVVAVGRRPGPAEPGADRPTEEPAAGQPAGS
ncbi:MFS transporter [Streptomyces sp. CHA1]|uniref:MFS transporter n=1 Tax=Streptomyces TaxID=1883 RepID=UPI0003C2DD91|nr:MULTISPECIES: MFS transporter [Streptomyces]QOZ99985.1 MFS transporter [Streptomyces violascens]UYM24673.1 MFS transporter [Streptomyces albus]WDV31928.1 MFS transporter [Streptomyces sp. AD16]ESQ04934.1 major facilitator superfamily protein [Streptomyces sp. PVA_94-07]MBP3078176.1 MFS transporter [Streptomyces sp. 604F]